MTVARILAVKGSEVFTVPPHRTMAEAVAVLAERRIGMVVVAGSDGGIAGILSERDVVRALAAQGPSVLAEPVSSHMTRKVVTAGIDATVDEVMERMTDGKFRHMPVVVGSRLIGIVSIGDLVKHRLAAVEAEVSAMRDYIATA